MSDRRPGGVVAIVEDELELADVYAEWLGNRFEIRRASEAESGVETIDETVDVLLLNRRLPDGSGDDVLAQLRADGFDTAVAMVSGVEPDASILSLELDEYLHKPVEREELSGVVDRLVALESQPRIVRAYLAATAKRETLRDALADPDRRSSEAYGHVTDAIEAFERRVLSLAEAYLDASVDKLPREDRRALGRDLRRLKSEQSDLSRTDPLWSVVRTEIAELEALLATARGDLDAERELVAAVAEGYVARDFWLDARINRALNLIFFDKDSERLVIDRTPLRKSMELDEQTLLGISRAVRNRARTLRGSYPSQV